MDRRALTLLELLMAVALLVALASLVMPMVFGRLAATEASEAPSQLVASIVQARAQAARTGEPVRVIAKTGEDGVVRIVHEPVRASVDSESAFVDLPTTPDGGMTAREPIDSPKADGAYVDLTLPKGCRIVSVASLEDQPVASGGAPADAIEPVDDEGAVEPSERALAILLPDGGAIAGERLALRTPNGLAYELSLDRWGYGAKLERWQAEDLDASFDDDLDAPESASFSPAGGSESP